MATMKAISIGSIDPEYAGEHEKPTLYLEGDQVKEVLGDFSFDPDTKYAVELEFEVSEWRKKSDGTECVTLRILSGGEAQEVGAAEEPKPEKKADVKVAKVTAKPAKPSDY